MHLCAVRNTILAAINQLQSMLVAGTSARGMQRGRGKKKKEKENKKYRRLERNCARDMLSSVPAHSLLLPSPTLPLPRPLRSLPPTPPAPAPSVPRRPSSTRRVRSRPCHRPRAI